MIITQHGKKDPLFKGVAEHQGQPLVFFGWNARQVQLKESEWLLANRTAASEVREKKRPVLRVINGGKKLTA